MESTILFQFDIAETKSFQKLKKKLDEKLYNKIKTIVYPQLRSNPYYGTNIKKLKGELEGYYRYRLGDYRLFYIIKNEKVIVVITNLKHRQSAYEL